ncbi:MAG: hypothetical protein DHS20C21_11380 [Gemmatimonadota bacterium]|nr:MAG: hypothetical protein DHS20C21_11380 [Gemmatimonadota bacterium]
MPSPGRRAILGLAFQTDDTARVHCGRPCTGPRSTGIVCGNRGSSPSKVVREAPGVKLGADSKRRTLAGGPAANRQLVALRPVSAAATPKPT